MQLILEILDPAQRQQVHTAQMCFGPAGGLIGRSPEADWVLEDTLRHVSNQHARISWQDGRFWLTDLSRNGTFDLRAGIRLPQGVAQPIAADACYRLGSLTLHARLQPATADYDAQAGRPMAAGSMIPDDAFLLVDLEDAHLHIDQTLTGLDVPLGEQQLPPAGIDREQLQVPRLLPASTLLKPPTEDFWSAYAAALGVSLDGLDQAACEQLVLDGAVVLRQSQQVRNLAHAYAERVRVITRLHSDFQE